MTVLVKTFIPFFLLIGLVAFQSCSEKASPSEQSQSKSDSLKQTLTENQRALVFPLNAELEDLPLDFSQLHGEFFDERAHFYILKKPNMNLFGSPVEQVTLYFIDSVLAKSSYRLETNISNRLINSLGKFSIKALNDSNSVKMKTAKVVTKENGWYRLNPDLDQYQLSWKRREYNIYMKVHKPRIDEEAIDFIEEVNYYKNALRYIEDYSM
ncbi:MAG: hypothetical protein AAGC88_08875 [Bacteroidota bacterium]